jgi:hypothetical protein
MLKRAFDFLCDFLQALILVQLLFAAAIAVSVLLYFVILTSFRVIQTVWVHLFSRPWP